MNVELLIELLTLRDTRRGQFGGQKCGDAFVAKLVPEVKTNAAQQLFRPPVAIFAPGLDC